MNIRPFLMIVLSFVAISLQAAEPPSPAKIRGSYAISSIEQKGPSEYLVRFVPEKPSDGPILSLKTSNLHSRLKAGVSLDLVADLVKSTGGEAEASQVMVMFKVAGARVPVWLISKDYGPRNLRGDRYLDMHAPTTDFLVF